MKALRAVRRRSGPGAGLARDDELVAAGVLIVNDIIRT